MDVHRAEVSGQSEDETPLQAEATVKELSSLFAGQEYFRFVADPRTNAVIVFGTREQQEKIQKLIATLDVPATEAQ
ncbi:MAG: secretin N-terminal domain-containing protein [Pirellulales bacterium]